MAQDRVLSEVRGVVACSNDRGLKLVGGDAWVNASKFAAVTMPPTGASVVLGLDKSGYIREITTAEGPSETVDIINGFEPSTAPADRETRIGRMAAINSTIALLSTGVAKSGPLTVEQVLTTAADLERWVNR